MTSHAEARDILLRVWPAAAGEPATLRARQFVQAVAYVESQYGDGWAAVSLEGALSNNWGSVKLTAKPPCPPNGFEHGDLGGPFCFRRYETPDDGAQDLVWLLTVKRPSVWKAAKAGDWRGAVAAMSATSYMQADVKAYTAAVGRSLKRIAAALGEPAPESSSSGAGASGGRRWLPYALAAAAGVMLLRSGRR